MSETTDPNTVPDTTTPPETDPGTDTTPENPEDPTPDGEETSADDGEDPDLSGGESVPLVNTDPDHPENLHGKVVHADGGSDESDSPRDDPYRYKTLAQRAHSVLKDAAQNAPVGSPLRDELRALVAEFDSAFPPDLTDV